MKDWKKFDKSIIKAIHDDMYYYRDLYKGRHAELFPRAINLIEKGEIVDNLRHGEHRGKNITTPYLMLNVCKMIVDVPTLLITRSIGQMKTSFPAEKQLAEQTTNEQAEMIEGTKDNSFNGEVVDPQQEMIDQIIDNSRLDHSKNLAQLQIDGGIVSVPAMINGQLKLMIKERNVYYPHDDGQGYDLVYEVPQTDEEREGGYDYVHVYSEVEEEDQLAVSHRLYKRNGESQLEQVTDIAFIQERLGIETLYQEFQGRKRSFINYLAHNATFMDELGVSALHGMANRQDEVNWTITRAAQTFERNGKPRISITKETMTTLQNMAEAMYGEGNSHKIDHRWLEIQEIGENGQTMQIHQIDIDKIGDMAYVKDIIRGMLTETQTSESAFDFVRRETSSPQSGVAKFYDLIVSLMKAEQMRKRYIEFLQEGIENCLWLANSLNPNIIIEKPVIQVTEMIPVTAKEMAEESIMKFSNGAQSLEETVKELHPDKSEEWVTEELERIESSQTSQDSMSMLNGNMSLNNFLNNTNNQGQPLDEAGQPVGGSKNETN
ncbi:hypothetical protein [Macrococcus brunensis]|uniref:hypothetical protein n=1 Tax=Macrococcus brunensis TaxID=198483 RepID=UPI001EF14924|nr:hypothetical protein [Macrococcus brunensis]ULG73016.1 hypothetical protein MGG12_05735 [Macrococcus brunensis]